MKRRITIFSLLGSIMLLGACKKTIPDSIGPLDFEVGEKVSIAGEQIELSSFRIYLPEQKDKYESIVLLCEKFPGHDLKIEYRRNDCHSYADDSWFTFLSATFRDFFEGGSYTFFVPGLNFYDPDTHELLPEKERRRQAISFFRVYRVTDNDKILYVNEKAGHEEAWDNWKTHPRRVSKKTLYFSKDESGEFYFHNGN